MKLIVNLLLSSLIVSSAQAQTCGGGNVGDGICSDRSLCCSEWGWCGSTDLHCAGGGGGGSQPAPAPVDAAPLPDAPAQSPVQEGRTRLIAYLGNWQSCPTEAEVAPYTHIVIAFAVSYTWAPYKNTCSTTCDIAEPPICNNSPNPALVNEWQAAGKKVILSFGGAGMGGSWAGDVNDCWEHCYGRETQVTNRLVDIVKNMNLDGVDIDFEYHVTPSAVRFLNEITVGLKNALPAGSEVTHAPMDSDIIPGKPYYDDVLAITGHQLDYLMPQYYNGATRPALDGFAGSGQGSMSARSHYASIVDGIFGGDANRMVFGFCISDCGDTGSNTNAEQASVVMTDLAQTYPCNGGAFFWVAEHDVGASWSTPVSSTINNLASTGCSSSPTTPVAPLPATTPSPPVAPLPETTPSPTASPNANTPVTPQPCCPVDYSGLRAWNNCLQYFHCVHGVVTGDVLDVPNGVLFDQSVGNFVWPSEMEECIVDECGGSGGRMLRGVLKRTGS